MSFSADLKQKVPSLSALMHWDFSSQVQNFVLMEISKTETSKRLLLPRLPVSHGVCELKFHQSAEQPHLPILYHLKIYWLYILSPYLGYWWRYWTMSSVAVHLLLCSFPSINWTSSYWLCTLSLGFWAIQPTYSLSIQPILHHIIIYDSAFGNVSKV